MTLRLLLQHDEKNILSEKLTKYHFFSDRKNDCQKPNKRKNKHAIFTDVKNQRLHWKINRLFIDNFDAIIYIGSEMAHPMGSGQNVVPACHEP